VVEVLKFSLYLAKLKGRSWSKEFEFEERQSLDSLVRFELGN
jgi:hypothetical protein